MMRTLATHNRGKAGRGTEKPKVFAALSLDKRGNPHFLKMWVTTNIKQATVKKFTHAAFVDGSVIYNGGRLHL